MKRKRVGKWKKKKFGEKKKKLYQNKRKKRSVYILAAKNKISVSQRILDYNSVSIIRRKEQLVKENHFFFFFTLLPKSKGPLISKVFIIFSYFVDCFIIIKTKNLLKENWSIRFVLLNLLIINLFPCEIW